MVEKSSTRSLKQRLFEYAAILIVCLCVSALCITATRMVTTGQRDVDAYVDGQRDAHERQMDRDRDEHRKFMESLDD